MPEMGFNIEKLSLPYLLAREKKWEEFHKYFFDNPAGAELLTKPIDVNKNTPLHRAACSGIAKIFEKLLILLTRNSGDNGRLHEALRMANESGNRLLHEVASAGESKMAESIFKRIGEEEQELQSLLLKRNKRGETPTLRAAAHGRTKLLEFFHLKGYINISIHEDSSMWSKDHMSILHVAVVTQNFGTAIWLLDQEEYRTLVNEKEGKGMTAFQLLAKMPSSFGSQKRLMGTIHPIIYFLLPKYWDTSSDSSKKTGGHPKFCDTLSDSSKKTNGLAQYGNTSSDSSKKSQVTVLAIFRILLYSYKAAQDVLIKMWCAICKFLAQEWKEIDKVWKKKEMNTLAKDLANRLAKEDYSWASCFSTDVAKELGQNSHSKDKKIEGRDNKNIECSRRIPGNGKSNLHTPLLMAAANGITEIVEAIIEEYPQAIDHVSQDQTNILLMAFKHRQDEIYRILKRNGLLNTLAQQMDSYGNTLFDYFQTFEEQSQTSAFMQLQSELRWFKRAEKLVRTESTVPTQHKKDPDQTPNAQPEKDQDQTPLQLFEKGHTNLLEKSQKWIKEIAQSCSTVAVLVATVVFAAALTVPGSTDDGGYPRFLNRTDGEGDRRPERRGGFLSFTYLDVISLGSLLASVIKLLSIVRSNFEMWDFLKILPRKLTRASTLCFISVITMTLSFSATLWVNLELQKSNITYTAALLPIGFLALAPFPLFVKIKESLWLLYKIITPHHLKVNRAIYKARTSKRAARASQKDRRLHEV